MLQFHDFILTTYLDIQCTPELKGTSLRMVFKLAQLVLTEKGTNLDGLHPLDFDSESFI